jgi:hypothetical protein
MTRCYVTSTNLDHDLDQPRPIEVEEEQVELDHK